MTVIVGRDEEISYFFEPVSNAGMGTLNGRKCIHVDSSYLKKKEVVGGGRGREYADIEYDEPNHAGAMLGYSCLFFGIALCNPTHPEVWIAVAASVCCLIASIIVCCIEI